MKVNVTPSNGQKSRTEVFFFFNTPLPDFKIVKMNNYLL